MCYLFMFNLLYVFISRMKKIKNSFWKLQSLLSYFVVFFIMIFIFNLAFKAYSTSCNNVCIPKRYSPFDIIETFERIFKYLGFANFHILMSWDGSDFFNKADVIVYEERITLDEKMRTKLTLEQKRRISDVIGRLKNRMISKARNFCR